MSPKRKAAVAPDHSDEDEEIAPNKKKVASGDGNSTVSFELSKNRKVSVRKFKGQVFVDIREFYDKNGQELPGKKGISLLLDQWEVLKSHLEGIQELFKSLN